MISRFFPPPKHDRWEDYFEPGEVLLWQGAPEPGAKFSWGFVVISIFGVPFLLAGLSSMGQGISAFFRQDGPMAIMLGLFFITFSVPFLLIGLALIFGPWLASIHGHKFVQYALTNKRAYIAKSFIKHAIDSYVIGPDNVITLEQGKFDSVKFATVHSHDSDGDKITKSVGFDWISEGRAVYHLIREIQKEAT
mgnify:CR=1 FL=1